MRLYTDFSNFLHQNKTFRLLLFVGSGIRIGISGYTIDADGIRMGTAAFLSGCAAPDFPFYRYWVSRSP